MIGTDVQVPTYFSSDVRERLFDYAVALACAARIFTAEQLARRAELSAFRDPVKRAREFLALFPDTFETLPSPYGMPARRRLTAKERRRRHLEWKPIAGVSQRAEHWLGLGDIWIQLAQNGGRPSEWALEWDKQFDVCCEWNGGRYLIEYQRTPITTRQWKRKWEQRIEWYKKQPWQVKPRVVLVNTTGQMDETICLPRGTVHVRSVEQLYHVLRPPRL